MLLSVQTCSYPRDRFEDVEVKDAFRNIPLDILETINVKSLKGAELRPCNLFR